MVKHPGQCQSISVASAVSVRGTFWFCAYAGALNTDKSTELLKHMMCHRSRSLYLILDNLPAYKNAR